LFTAEHYSDALGIFQNILSHLSAGAPCRVQIAKFAAEAAINTGDRSFALDTLKPITDSDASDWQAAGMLARAYAETGQKEQRDTELAQLIDLHTRAVSPQIAKLQQILLERIPLASGSIRIWYSLEPGAGSRRTSSLGFTTNQSSKSFASRSKAAILTSRCLQRSTPI
jgi:hypothetical protein